jgi:hypothetical protein
MKIGNLHALGRLFVGYGNVIWITGHARNSKTHYLVVLSHAIEHEIVRNPTK